MEKIKNIVSLPDYCTRYDWPTKHQWLHWIYSKNPIAQQCVKRISNRYFINLSALETYIDQATLSDATSERFQ